MLRLPAFEYHSPASLEEALALLDSLHQAGQGARIIAGGTDLLPNMKHKIETPGHLVSLGEIGLRGITSKAGCVRIGAMTRIGTLAEHETIRDLLPALAEACSQIAGPQLRRMGTLGGNLCLDTRCVYVNQSHFWRTALGHCLKKDGTLCHVVKGGRRCVAAFSSDSALPLLAYRAEITLRSSRGERSLPLRSFYVADGVLGRSIEPDEILTEVVVPAVPSGVSCVYEKLRRRRSIDFALVNLALRVARDTTGRLSELDAVVGALGARPKTVSLNAKVRGRRLDSELVEQIASAVRGACTPLTNIADDPSWRRAMLKVLARRALGRL